MAFSNAYQDQPEDEEAIQSQINITPLTDIFLVLLIIFMVTSTALTQSGMAINLPQAKNSGELPEKKKMIVALEKDGTILIDNQAVDIDSIEKAFAGRIEKNSETTIVMEGDQDALLGKAVRVMDAAKQAGAAHIVIATRPGMEDQRSPR